ncbi:MAG: tryptophan 7-halogenase [Fimbriimonadales bacterium]|nr:tryptophan 7-halogenase [Fimbriimonadales bacterium]
MNFDVAIIGGGPAGSTVGTILKKYDPNLSVAIFEREAFPREHVGESQLPPISKVLNEMGCWEKVESAGFPIKIGATYRWGRSPKLWDFEFMPVAEYKDEPRPGKYEGQRRRLAFQVDRAIYDKILLDHAREMNCAVYEETKVSSIKCNEDRVEGLILENGKEVTARQYVDCSGGVGLLRRTIGVEIDAPTKLKNVAFWDYWENTEWAVRIGTGATRVLVLSIGSGWIWFIPLGPTRTSIGFICPAEFYKQSNKSPDEIYSWALEQEPLIRELTANATRENSVRATKDWSFIAKRMVGENWFLAGESAGFADPILAAGLTLSHTGARECAYTILELDRGEHDPCWLKLQYEAVQKRRIGQHIRFADFWYSANGIFTDLQEYTTQIARDAGLELSPQKAFQWLGTGGFTDDNLGQVGVGGLDLAGARQVSQIFMDSDYEWELSKYNEFRLNVEGAELIDIPTYENGTISRIPCYLRGNKHLPVYGFFKTLIAVISEHKDITRIVENVKRELMKSSNPAELQLWVNQAMQAMEVMIGEGWLRGKLNLKKPRLAIGSPREGTLIHTNVDLNERLGLN